MFRMTSGSYSLATLTVMDGTLCSDRSLLQNEMIKKPKAVNGQWILMGRVGRYFDSRRPNGLVGGEGKVRKR